MNSGLLARVRSFLRGVRRPDQFAADMDEEMRFHIELEAERLVRERGLDPREALRQAAIAFGGVEKRKEEGREVRGLAWASGLSLDLKLAWRMLMKSPGLTVVAGLGMAFAIAVGVGFFIVGREILYPKLPLDEGDRIIALENWDVKAANEWRHAVHDFVTWREEMRSVEQISAFSRITLDLVDGDSPPLSVRGARMTASGFEVARVAPLLGRYLVEEDERPGAPRVAVIGHALWQARFNGDPEVVGRVVLLGDSVHTIVGVMPDGYRFPWYFNLWMPLRVDPSRYERGEGPELFVFGRLAPGATMEQARAELEVIGRRTAAAFPETHAGLRPQVLPYTYPLNDIQNPGIGLRSLTVTLSFISLLLVVVAMNVSILVYARTAARRGELAMRTALGASRRRIIGQLFLEALALSAASAVLGLFIARGALMVGEVFMERMEGTGFWLDWSLNAPTVIYAVGLAVLAGVIVGVLPGLQSTGPQLQRDLRSMGGGSGIGIGRVWTTLIILQVALVVASLPLATNAAWDVAEEMAGQPAYPDEFLGAEITTTVDLRAGMDGAAYRQEAAERLGQRIEELHLRLDAEPEVAGVAISGTLPGVDGAVEVEGGSATPESPGGHRVATHGVGAGYLDLLGARTLAGWGFERPDARASGKPVIVNRAFTRRVLGSSDALGRRIRFVDGDAETGESRQSAWYEIVGVVEDLWVSQIDPALNNPVLYYPVAPGQLQSAELVIRVRGEDPRDFTPRLRAVIASLDPELVLLSTRSLARSEAPPVVWLVIGTVVLILAVVVLFSAAGIHALMSFAVTQRQKEIGIRTALGAGRRRLLTAIFSRAAGQVGIGIALGSLIGGGILLGEGGSLAARTAPILLLVASLVAVVGIGAAAGPARRGLAIQPMEALRDG